jgi:hypothetical protein
MSTGAYYSLLLMLDDGHAHRWRIGRRLFRVLCCISVLLPLLLGGAGWLLWHLYQDNAGHHIQQRQLEEENKTLAATIRRLANLEQLLTMSENARQSALQNQQAKLRAAEQSAPPPETPPQENPKDRNQGDAIGLDGTQPAQPAPIVAVDLKCVTVENVQTRRQGNNLRISLDLLNALQKNQIGGHVACTLKSPTGEIFLLEIPRDIASFRISRLKRAVFAPVLPVAARNIPALSLVLEITLEEWGIVYRNEFPIDQ